MSLPHVFRVVVVEGYYMDFEGFGDFSNASINCAKQMNISTGYHCYVYIYICIYIVCYGGFSWDCVLRILFSSFRIQLDRQNQPSPCIREEVWETSRRD